MSQADKSVCELALIQGQHVSCPYDVARSTLPRLEYLSADDWLVAVTDCQGRSDRGGGGMGGGGIYPPTFLGQSVIFYFTR